MKKIKEADGIKKQKVGEINAMPFDAKKYEENRIIDDLYEKHSDDHSFNFRIAMKEFADLEVARVVPLHKEFVAENIKLTEQNRRLYGKLTDSYNVLGECVDAINWALENCKPDRPELQSDLFNILTNAMEAGNRTLRGEKNQYDLQAKNKELERQVTKLDESVGLLQIQVEDQTQYIEKLEAELTKANPLWIID